jgi:putative ABC transport system permease protein
VARIRTLEAAVASSTADSRFDAWLFGLFAAVALALTAVGIHGMLSFSVARRTSEIGTRIALGATHARVLEVVLKQGVTPLVFGLMAGLAGALAVTRPLSSLLFGVHPTYWPPYLAVPALVLAVGVLASYLPAHRATKVDPLIALRSE